MTASHPRRALFVDSFLVEPEAALPEPASRYDDERDLTVLNDGTPLVEASSATGTSTMTKNDGERSDADEAARVASAGTMTATFATGERVDDDAAARWGGTQLDTRTMPADVETD